MKKIWVGWVYLGMLFCLNSNISLAQTVSPEKSRRFYKNPVFNHDFPDPNLLKGKDGYFYAYATETNWTADTLGGPYIMPILRSKNLMQWDLVGSVLAKKPTWKAKGGIWAPDASYYKGKYYVYYSFSTWGDPDPGIGLAIGSKPQGPFTDLGKVFFSKEIGVANSIDPFIMEDNGNRYLVWGSFHGIFANKVSADGIKLLDEKFQLAGNAYEGAYIYKRGKYFYFFGSTGSCCEGIKSTYAVKVSRATTFFGPYLDRNGKSLLENGGSLLLQGNDGTEGFVGPGHNGDIFKDTIGDTWFLYHAFDKQKPNKRVLMLDKIEWKDDWPYIQHAQPSFTLQKGPIFKEKR